MSSSNAPDRYRYAVIPHVMVTDANHAMAFYANAFGAEEVFRVGGPNETVLHAEMMIAGSLFMVGDAAEPLAAPAAGRRTVVGLHVYVDDVDALTERAVSVGAEVLQEPLDMFYGDRSAMLRDPFGHVWVLLQHLVDLSPEEIEARGRELVAASPAP
jgi:PhnB protein